MSTNTLPWFGAVIALAAVVVAVVYQWRQRSRVRLVECWVKNYLVTRFGELPNRLNINCSNDRLWPVVVAFGDIRNEIPHRLQFSCTGDPSTFSLVSDREEARS
jgi:hypothetical protein